jgi:hypothetical protein
MSKISIDNAADRPTLDYYGTVAEAHRVAMGALSAGDFCRLAEECFLLAAVAKTPKAAVELLKAGDDYLRCAAGLA